MTQDSDLAPSGKALKQAASWLGVSDPVKLLDDDSAADAFQPRPEGLGLGARFLPHHKAAHLTMPLEKRFGKRLQRSTIDEADKPASSALKHRRPVGKYQAQDSNQQPDNSSEDEEAGRSTAFGSKRPLQRQVPAAASQQQPQKKKTRKQKTGIFQKP